MMQTIEAEIDAQGRVHLLEKIKIGRKRRALVTILDDEKIEKPENSIVGSMEILEENLEIGSRDISGIFNKSLSNSAKELSE